MMGYKVAVVGATGNVGREMLTILAERTFPADEVIALASRRSMGVEVSFGDKILKIKTLEHLDFSDVDICLMSAGSPVAKEWAPKIAAAGAVVIDNSSCWRYEADVPLIVPEVNADAIVDFRKRGIIANPNCSTAQLVVALKPLHDKAKIKRVVVATYQSASGAGRALVEELEEQTRALAGGAAPEAREYPHQLAHNVVPGGWPVEDGDEGYNEEEVKILNETRKILHAPDLRAVATCVRVPVPVGHGEAVFVETERELSADEAREVLRTAEGVVVQDGPGPQDYPTPAAVAGTDGVYVGRIRRDLSASRGLAMWVVSDNLRKGAALNAVQIAERALRMGLLEGGAHNG